jgi:hypothetical protein
VSDQREREQAVQDALVTAQELRVDIRDQAQREAESVIKAAETEGRRLIAEAEAEARTKTRSSERRADKLADEIQELERRRARFIKDFRQLLERELDVVDVEADRTPLEERTIDLELGSRRAGEPVDSPQDVPAIAPEARPEEIPPGDAPVDQLAAAYQRTEAQAEVPPDQAAGDPQIAPPATGRRHDNVILYLDPDDAESGG